jgi:uncharacterized membrane protein YciS (DUF1049 family)
MLIVILAIVVLLVAWALHLMQQAVDRREFSLMLAGTLVASSAAAMLAVYFLMGSCIGYLTSTPAYLSSPVSAYESDIWSLLQEDGSGQDLLVQSPISVTR